jgi:hypothetical protein
MIENKFWPNGNIRIEFIKSLNEVIIYYESGAVREHFKVMINDGIVYRQGFYISYFENGSHYEVKNITIPERLNF